ncbi:MAG: hydroxyacid dehydrogenase [bacterium]|nr:hydroxyacid dehydrogenase [bacterium]
MPESVRRPTALLVMSPALTQGLMTAAHHLRLAGSCDLTSSEPLETFDDPRADLLLADAEVLLTAWGCPPLDAKVLERAPKLAAIMHAAGTVKNHVTEAVFERGIRVSSAAAANALPVAEFALAAILLANKRAFALQRRYREVRGFRFWSREEPGIGNFGKRVGLVGLSRIGRRLAQLLRPFDLEVVAWDPTMDAAAIASHGATAVPLDELLASSDVTSLHAPLLPETHGLIDARRLALMPDAATLVNTARGALVDDKALERELVSGRLRAVLDTTEPEVLPANSPLYDLPNVFLTPHIAGALGAETGRMVDLALDEIERFARDEPLLHEVRPDDWSRIA